MSKTGERLTGYAEAVREITKNVVGAEHMQKRLERIFILFLHRWF